MCSTYLAGVQDGLTQAIILKDFALTWTVLLLAVEVSLAIELGAGLSAQASEADKASYGFAAVLGLGLIAMYWFFPTVGALALGFLLRRPSVVERGPTGRPALTAGSEGAAAPDGPAGEQHTLGPVPPQGSIDG